VDPIDRSLLAELSEMLGPRLETIIETFVTHLDGHLASIREALDAGDMAALRAAAHRLKGSAGSIGALALSDVAARLEHAAADGDGVAVAAHAAPLEDTARDAVLALRSR
jgi:HPt (histidine-containing phosphotransfer) domain-containing protein